MLSSAVRVSSDSAHPNLSPLSLPTSCQRELDFRLRIIRHRAGGDEFSHDFYGDKVKNVKDYRRWLKEQRKIRRKKETGVTVDAEPASKPAA